MYSFYRQSWISIYKHCNRNSIFENFQVSVVNPYLVKGHFITPENTKKAFEINPHFLTPHTQNTKT